MDEVKHYEEMYGYGPSPAQLAPSGASDDNPLASAVYNLGASFELKTSVTLDWEESAAILAALRSRLSSPTPASAEIPPEAWGRLAEDVDELRHPERHTASESAEELADDLCAMIGIKREGSTSIEMRKRLAAHDAKTKREAADRAWPLLKQEYEWRKEDSECGGDEVSEGLDMLRARLDTAILGEGKA